MKMNVFIFTGNLGKDAEVKVLAGGTYICEFSVAVKSGNGEKEKTNWVRCTMFGKRAEGQLPRYLKKETQVAITGELELQEWDGQNGKGAAMAVKVSELDIIYASSAMSELDSQPYISVLSSSDGTKFKSKGLSSGAAKIKRSAKKAKNKRK